MTTLLPPTVPPLSPIAFCTALFFRNVTSATSRSRPSGGTSPNLFVIDVGLPTAAKKAVSSSTEVRSLLERT